MTTPTESAGRARAGGEHARKVRTRETFGRIWRNYARDRTQLVLSRD